MGVWAGSRAPPAAPKGRERDGTTVEIRGVLLERSLVMVVICLVCLSIVSLGVNVRGYLGTG